MEEWRVLVGNKAYWIQHLELTFKKESEATEYYDWYKKVGYAVRLQLRLDPNEKFETVKADN